MKNLPLGIQTFSKIIESHSLYVDKTSEILKLFSGGNCYFFSRPRRFGKSLLVSTLKEIFLGNRALFEGLYIYDKIQWEKHPVIHIDFSMITHDTPQHFEESLGNFLNQIAAANGISFQSHLCCDKFRELIEKMSSTNKVVVLIDEYDKPIIDHVSNLEKARANREILHNFFSVLKGSDPYLHFVFLTGVSKFSKVSIFSGLNNIVDITLSEQFATLAGITQEELVTNFQEYIEALAKKQGLNQEPLLAIIKHWYNGYSWDGVNRLYNPTSLLNLFFDNRFGNYWFATGTPSFLINLIKERQIDIAEIDNQVISSSLMDSYNIETLELQPLLFQTGYLTIAEIIKIGQIEQYKLKFPNFEVKESLLNYLLASFTDFDTSSIQPLYMDLLKHLAACNIPAFRTLLTSLFSRIPYNLHIKEERYYHSLCYMILALLGADIHLEVLSDKGRMDGVLVLENNIYVIEFKMGTAATALAQIKAQHYWEPYLSKGKELYLLGIGGFAAKQIEVLVEKA